MDAPSIWHTRSSNSSSTWSSTPAACSRAPSCCQEVWGYDYYGGTRTVDVHIRRLRAKLGGEYEHLIGTVRNVGYRFDPPETDKETAAAQQAAKASSAAIDTDDDTPDLNTVA